MGSTLVCVKCPLTSSLGEFLGYWAGSGILGYCPCWCPSPFPSPSISWYFSIHSSSPAVGFHSCFFFMADVSAPIRYFSIHSSTRCCDPAGVCMVQKSRQISALAGVEPRTLASSSREHYH